MSTLAISVASFDATALLWLASGLVIGWLVTRWRRNQQPAGPLHDETAAAVSQQLDSLARQLADNERIRSEQHGELKAHAEVMGRSSEELRTKTAELVTALRSPQVRGRWGEVQLRRVVELAGLVEHCDFEEQAHFMRHNDETRTAVRPDLLVKLPDNAHIVVDAKVSFIGYLEAMEATDADVAAERMRAHARHLRTHVDALASKQYWADAPNSPEFVVMFVPAEPFLTAALDVEPSLLEYGFERNVVITTPATLIALLRTVSWGWRQRVVGENAEAIHRLGRDLYARLGTFAGHLDKVGRSLETAVGAYNQSIGSWDSRLLPTARRLDELGVGDATMPNAAVVDLGVRPMGDAPRSHVG